jgi:hypothetical protein
MKMLYAYPPHSDLPPDYYPYRYDEHRFDDQHDNDLHFFRERAPIDLHFW